MSSSTSIYPGQLKTLFITNAKHPKDSQTKRSNSIQTACSLQKMSGVAGVHASYIWSLSSWIQQDASSVNALQWSRGNRLLHDTAKLANQCWSCTPQLEST